MLLPLCYVHVLLCLSALCEDLLDIHHYPSTVNIACQQLTNSKCKANSKVESFCLGVNRGKEAKMQTKSQSMVAQFDSKESKPVGKDSEVEGNGANLEGTELKKGKQQLKKGDSDVGTENGANETTKTGNGETKIEGYTRGTGTGVGANKNKTGNKVANDEEKEPLAGKMETKVDGKSGRMGTVVNGKERKLEGTGTNSDGKERKLEGTGTHSDGKERKLEGTGTHSDGKERKLEGTGTHSDGKERKLEGTGTHSDGKERKLEGTGTNSDGKERKLEGTGTNSDGKERKLEGTGTNSDGKERKLEGTGTNSDGKENGTEIMGKKVQDNVRRKEKSKHLAVLTKKMMYILELPTYRVTFKTRKDKLRCIYFNEHDKHLYWISERHHHPVVGYFLGNQRKQILSKPKGNFGSIAFDTSTLYVTYASKRRHSKQMLLYSAKMDNTHIKLKFVCMVPLSIGPMMVNAKLSTIYMTPLSTTGVVEVNITTGKIERRMHQKELLIPLIPMGFADKATIYICIPTKNILALDIGTWTVKRIHVKLPKGLWAVDVRQDQIILFEKKRIYMYNRKWILISKPNLKLGEIVKATLMT